MHHFAPPPPIPRTARPAARARVRGEGVTFVTFGARPRTGLARAARAPSALPRTARIVR